MTAQIRDWFRHEILWWMSFSAVFWGAFLQFLGIYVLLLPSNPWNPLTPLWILLSPTSWIYDFLSVSCIAVMGYSYESSFTLAPFVRRGTFPLLVSMFSRIPTLGLHLVVGGVLMRCYVGLCGGITNGLTRACDGTTCLNDAHLFTVLSGCFFGMYQWYDYHFQNGSLVQFPMVTLQKKSQIRLKLVPIIKESMVNVAVNFRWFLIFYVIQGESIRSFLIRLLRIDSHHQLGETWTSYFWNLCWLSLHAWVLNTLLLSSLKVLQLLLNVYMTEPVEFALEEEGVVGEGVGIGNSLIEAMEQRTSPLLRHLAFLDFATLAAESRVRRSHFFKLSQPGGHPHNWNHLNLQCESAINDFVEDLSRATQSTLSIEKKDKEVKYETPSLSSDLRMRRLAQPILTSTPISNTTDLTTPSTIDTNTVMSQAWKKLSKNPVFNALPDANVRSVFAEHSNILCWIVEGLSHMIASSVQEDRYGVVQKTLPNLLVLILNLQQTIERHKGMTVSMRKNKSEAKDLQLKNELRNSIKLSLYRISVAYGDHLHFIPGISAEFQQKLKNYHSFME